MFFYVASFSFRSLHFIQFNKQTMPKVTKRVAAARLNAKKSVRLKNGSGRFVSSNALFFSSYRERCLKEYQQFIEGNSAVDVGHDVNHVMKVERLGSQALEEYIDGDINDYQCWLGVHSQESFNVPLDVKTRVEIAGLLHEYGDHKLCGDGARTRNEMLGDVIDRVASDYTKYTEEFRNDVIRMIDLCSASKWGDIIPENTKLYQLIPRWSDRQEATGAIGIARCLIYNYNKRSSNSPLVLENDDFPTDLNKLNEIAPYSRFEEYSKGKPSLSAFSHLMDKIRHINGKDIPILCLKNIMNEGQMMIDKFIIDFTVVNEKKIDIDWVISLLDERSYDKEILELRKMKDLLRIEKCPWIF